MPLSPRRAEERKTNHHSAARDPLDGTTNFAHGYPCFAVSIGLEEAGDLIAGVIYQPVSGELFTATKGEGAYLNQKKSTSLRLKSSDQPPRDRFERKTSAESEHPFLLGFHLRSDGVRRDGSAAMDLASVACGDSKDFGVRPASWDTAAGVLLLREAAAS